MDPINPCLGFRREEKRKPRENKRGNLWGINKLKVEGLWSRF